MQNIKIVCKALGRCKNANWTLKGIFSRTEMRFLTIFWTDRTVQVRGRAESSDPDRSRYFMENMEPRCRVTPPDL